MRTTIDMPDALFRRAKKAMATRHVTFRALVIDALEQSLEDRPEKFVLRDASAGYTAKRGKRISSADINRAIDDTREPKNGQ